MSSIVFAAFVWASDRGFDFSDESYYLLSIEAPQSYVATGTHFGFLLRPVYLLLGGSIHGLRLFGATALAVASVLAAYCFLPAIERVSGAPPPRPFVLTMFTAAATAPFLYYALWAPTPSYNWLTLFAGLALVSALGLLLEPTRHASSALLAGGAGTAAFLAKPTAGVAFAFFYSLAALLALGGGRALVMQIVRAAAITLGILAVVALTLIPPIAGYQQFASYFDYFAGMSRDTNLASLRVFISSGSGAVYIASFTLALTVILVPAIRHRWGKAGAWALAVITLLLGREQTFSLHVTAVASVLAFTAIAISASGLPPEADRRPFLVLCLCVFLPWGIAAGTDNDLVWMTSLSAGIPALTAIIAALFNVTRHSLLAAVVTLGIPMMSAWALWTGLQTPYRVNGPLWSQTVPVEIGWRSASLQVDNMTRSFVDELRRSALANGWEKNSPLIDFTGRMPGAAVVLRGRTPGVPWLLGGYDGSETFVRKVMAGISPEDRRLAWLLHSDKPYPFTPEFLQSLGFDLARSYKLVGEAVHPFDKAVIRLYAPLR